MLSLNFDGMSLESFRFEDENEYEFNLKFFARVLKKRHPGKLHFTFFHQKSEYGYLRLSPSSR